MLKTNFIKKNYVSSEKNFIFKERKTFGDKFWDTAVQK